MQHSIISKLAITILLAALSIGHFGCGNSRNAAEQNREQSQATNAKFAVKLIWPAPPRAETYVDAILEFRDASGVLARNIKAITFLPEMPSMGHGTSTQQQTFQRLGTGKIKVSKIFFSMGGDWVIKVSADIGTGADTATINVDVI